MLKITKFFRPAAIKYRADVIKIAVNTAWLSFDRIIKMIVSLVVIGWMARYLGPEQFGLLNFIVAFTGLFVAISVLGLKDIVVRDIVQDTGGAQITLGTSFVLQIIAGCLAYITMIGAVLLFRPDDRLVLSLAVVLGAGLTIKFTDTVTYWFEAHVLSKYTVWMQNGAFLIFAMVKVLLIIKGAPLIAFAWAMFLEALLTSVFLLILMTRRGIAFTYLKFDVGRAQALLKDSWPLIISAIAVTLYMRIDQVMLGLMIGDDAVGVYSAAVRVSEFLYFIPMAICTSVFPALLICKKTSEEQYYFNLQKLFDIMVVISLCVAIPMTFMATSIVTFIYGVGYAESGQLLALHTWASIFVFLGVAGSQWFIAENKQVLHLKRTILGAVVNIILNLWLVPLYQATGAAMATIAAQAVGTFFADILERDTRQLFLMKLRALTFINVIKIAKYKT
jgi:O-antigen/teichoic acid export membrane protein